MGFRVRNGTPQYEPIAALGKLGDYEGVPFLGGYDDSLFGVAYGENCRRSGVHNGEPLILENSNARCSCMVQVLESCGVFIS